MRYYKILQDGHFVGAVNSNNFMRFSPLLKGFLRSDENYGEYISYNGILYRSGWMWPLGNQDITYENAQIVEIQEEEYEAYIAAIASNQEIEDTSNSWEGEEEEQPNPVDVESLAFITQSKIKEMSHACQMAIENGFDIELNDGNTHHFSLTIQDQLNLMTLSAAAETEELIAYHADGEQCVFYTAEEIKAIVAAAQALKTYETTYFNALKSYINSLETIEEVSAITYGIQIPPEFQTEVLKVLRG